MKSWRSSTKKQYDTYLKQWTDFCKQRKRTDHRFSIGLGLEFLQRLHQRGLGYSAINSARSAISSFMSQGKIDFGSHKLVCQFMRGIFNLKPSLPRYSAIWDPEPVLLFLKRLTPCRTLSLKLLTFKVVTLLALITVQRIQTLHALTLDSISFTDDHIKIVVTSLLKTSRPSWHMEPIILCKYSDHKRLCIYRYLSEYVERTRVLRGAERKLFISFQKPHRSVSKSTISRWICIVLRRSGINVEVFKAHSTRAASASKAFTNVPIEKVLAAGGWSSSSSFHKHYNLQPLNAPVQQALLHESQQ